MVLHRLKRKLIFLWQYSLYHPFLIRDIMGVRWAYRRRSLKAPLPVEIDVEPINTCNFKCPHCQVTYWDKKPGRFDRDTFLQVLNQIPNLIKVKLQGMGEPLLNKQLIPMLQAGEERGIQMYFHTNGSIGSLEKHQELVKLQRTHIAYSIDGATPETFEKVRPGSKFNKIVENILNLTKLRPKHSKLLVSAWTVVTQKNIQELPQIVSLSKKLGLDRIVIQPHLTNWGKETMTDRTDSIQVETESDLFATKIAQAQDIAASKGLDLDINTSNRFSQDRPCHWPWKSSYIAANGDVVPCCVIADADVVKMGNVFEQEFKEIWNGKAYQELRSKIASHDLPHYCKHCYLDPDR